MLEMESTNSSRGQDYRLGLDEELLLGVEVEADGGTNSMAGENSSISIPLAQSSSCSTRIISKPL
jgi:hypothetical protein